MLEVSGIEVSYGHIDVLHDVSLRVDGGEVVALVGANGAGKTTTLRAISALVPPAEGTVTLDGERIDRLRPEQIAARGVAHLPEGRGIFPSLTVEENLRIGYFTRRRNRAGWSSGTERVTALFPRLAERWQQPAGTLSGGEQQMLALGRALLPDPRLLMIDELSLGLAPVVVQNLFKVLEGINRQGTTVLLVEQYVRLALKVATRAYVLEKGRIALEGRTEELLEGGDAVRSLYLGAGDGGSRRRRRVARRSTEEVTEDGVRPAASA